MKMRILITAICLLGVSVASGQQLPPVFSETIYKKGDNGFDTYRIPAVVQTPQGTILAFAEARKHSKSDTGDIDLVVRRSTDGGRTWGDIITVWDDGANVCGNPAPVVDRTTGRILLLSTWNDGTDHERHIHDRTAKDTRRVYLLYSDDEGLTWSAARELTPSVKKADWTWYATGPCHAIQLRKGKHKGRIVVPCNHGVFRDGKPDGSQSHVIYSDDGGASWAIGGDADRDGNESTVAELRNGDLMLNMRGPRSKGRAENGSCRLMAVSRDAGLTFEPNYYDRALTEPVCNGSMVNYTPKGRLTGKLLFSNPDHPTKRRDMTVKISRNSGKSWEVAYKLCDIAAAYSDMVVLPGGDVAVMYETGEQTVYDRIDFSVIPAEVFE